MAAHDDPWSEYGPTYKALFLGACIIIGSTFGWWLTNFISSVDRFHASSERRETELEAGLREQRIETKQLYEIVRENTRILRELEREAVRRTR
jgi:hypothetical protein